MSMIETNLPEPLQLEPVGAGAYRIPAREEALRDVVHGVQLMAWSMIASATEGIGTHSVKTAHGIFSRPTARTSPIEIALDRLSSGRAFGADTVTVTQDGKNCARVQLLLSADEEDLIRHADEMPSVPRPEECEEFVASAIGIAGIDVRSVGEVDYVSSGHPVVAPELNLWIRSTDPIEGRVPNQAMLCACTGTTLIGTAMLPHAGIGQDQAHRTISTGVVGHTITYHEPVDLGDWLLLAQESIYAGHGRAHGRARVFDRDGQLVASYVQDAIIRHFADRQDHSAEARTAM
jgi:acyl-CoA thioesterase-2